MKPRPRKSYKEGQHRQGVEIRRQKVEDLAKDEYTDIYFDEKIHCTTCYGFGIKASGRFTPIVELEAGSISSKPCPECGKCS